MFHLPLFHRPNYWKSVTCEASHVIFPILLLLPVSNIQIFLSNFVIFALGSV